MRTWTRVQDGRGKPCLLLEDSPLWCRVLFKLFPRQMVDVYDKRSRDVLIHLSPNKTKEVDR